MNALIVTPDAATAINDINGQVPGRSISPTTDANGVVFLNASLLNDPTLSDYFPVLSTLEVQNDFVYTSPPFIFPNDGG